MGIIRVKDHSGNTHELEAVEGWRVMEIIREHGLDIEGLCGGACECATCHVHVSPDWAARISPATDDEEDKLDELPILSDTSRLSCQIIWSEALDGLELTLAEQV
ncbi:2Fe-2S iron-sulfur cluster binding domain-containing protein [Kaustia mangrovi]|uniref:2Fe-2S iron-sulfur cluster binding domain-containing protein n=1 Tax=Kaustia mangrovi TaxID=2593653 RepID=A0A7S8HDU6_9HYPH|nr:2Fe-2S iron-sulfur cluster-binding protein [Kaustia mangrovi]QPC45015.1 2Fe-2S iron-sulfur cluster binding domain-containing protein [Kaustia mangrovi]